MVKELDPHIKKAFSDLGFSDDEIKKGCWLLEKAFKKGEEKKPIAWIALHKFLERVADKAGITFDKPEIMNCQDYEIAVYVNGNIGEKKAWSIGEASTRNCINEYRWAMAEKRAKDRVILKLLGVAGDMYSEEEADEFKRYNEQQENEQKLKNFKNEVANEKRKLTIEKKKQVEQAKNTKEYALQRFEVGMAFVKKLTKINPNTDMAVMKAINQVVDVLSEQGLSKELEEFNSLVNSKIIEPENDSITY